MAGVTSEPTAQSGRFVVTNRPAVSPGSCGVCGYADDRRKYIDMRMDFEFYGSLYLCEVCIGELANLIGYIHPDIDERQEQEIAALNERVEELTEALVRSERTVDLLAARRMSDAARFNSVPATNTARSEEVLSESDNGTVAVTEGDSESVGAGETGSFAEDNGEGPDDSSDITSTDSIFGL